MAVSLTSTDIVKLRMTALLLTSNSFTNAVDVTEHLFALQGQDFAAARWALAIRAGTPDSPAPQTAIATAFNSGKIIRSWPMRGTVHILSAKDIGWMQQLTNPGVLKAWPKRREFLQLDLSVFEHAREITGTTLEGGKSLPRTELIDAWSAAGIEMHKGWSYHLIWALAQHGDIVFGPMNDSGDLEVVLASEWIKNPTEYDEDDGIAEFCVRYLTGHGPATLQDLMWWSQLPARTLKIGIQKAGDRIVGAVSGSTNYLVLPEQLEGYRGGRRPGSLLALGPFDEHLLGYKDRSLQVDPQHARKVMTVNGLGQPTIVRNGRVVAVWKMRDGSFEVLDEEKVTKRDLAASEKRIGQARSWLGRN